MQTMHQGYVHSSLIFSLIKFNLKFSRLNPKINFNSIEKELKIEEIMERGMKN